MALALLRRGETLTNSLCQQATGADSRVATRELGDLVSTGIVEQVGTRRWASYHLASAPAAETGRRPEVELPKQRRDRRPEILQLLRERGQLARAELAQRLA